MSPHLILLSKSSNLTLLIHPAPSKHCSICTLSSNLWLCLTCGFIGCGRSQFGNNLGGNNHGVQHYESTGHGVCVKLGSISADGGADVYCHHCGDSVVDGELAGHLKRWGITVGESVKTEKSMTELVGSFLISFTQDRSNNVFTALSKSNKT